MRHRREPFDRRALAGSVLTHAGILLVAVWSSAAARPPERFVAYEIELVSPPPARQAEESQPAQEELVVERPQPSPPPPPEETPDRVEETPAEKTPPVRREPEPAPAEPAEEKATAASEEPPEETSRESGADINVRLEGVRRDYPAYYDNIIVQIQRCFRWSGAGNWETTVYFVIRRDGTVGDLDFVSRSGNAAFDFAAMGAVECAGRGRFGPLPDELPFERLPVQFNFRPSGGVGDHFDDSNGRPQA